MRPYVLYVRFLITKGHSELEHVQSALSDLYLYPTTQEEFDQQHDLVFNTVPKSISDQIDKKVYEGDFLKWMKVLEIGDLWLTEKQFRTPETSHLKLVIDINNDPILRNTLRGLILKGAISKEICQDTNNKFSYMLKESHVDAYRALFWDPSRMTRASWKSYIKLCDDYEKSLLFLCLTEDIDVVKTYLDLPTKANVLGVYQQTFVSISQKVKHYLKFSDPDSNAEARMWIKTMLDVGDKYKKYETGNIEDFGKTLQLKFEYVENDFPTPDEMTRKTIDENKISSDINNHDSESK